MPRFHYDARDGSGNALAGELVAPTQAEAIRHLRSQGKYVVRLSAALAGEAAEVVIPRIGGTRVRFDDVIFFCHQLAGMVDTGVPIAEALEATIADAPPGAFRNTVEDLIERVQGGQDLSSALAAHQRAFPPIFIQLVRASEVSGTLGKMLLRISEYLTAQRELRRKIRSALTYPLCMLVFAAGVTVFLLTYVLPNFTSIYASKQVILPMPTRILMAVSGWFTAHWVPVLCVTVLSVIALILFLRTERGGRGADWLRLNAPLFGTMFRNACLTRAFRTMGTMISSGVSVVEAVQITRDVVGNRLFGERFEASRRRMEEGERFSETLRGDAYIPRPIWQMIHAGEKSGALGTALQRTADLCESDFQVSVKNTTQFIEPALIVTMGVIVGGIALAVLLPIFQISKVMVH